MLLAVLEEGVLPAEHGFSRAPGTAIPKFLQGLWRDVVGESGQLLPGFNWHRSHRKAVAALLQVSSLFSKYEGGFPKELIPEYIEDFVNTDHELEQVTLDPALISVARTIVAHVMCHVDLRDISPRHGPGAVASGERGTQKWQFARLLDAAHQAYPYYEFFVGGGVSELEDRLEWYMGLERVPSGTAKLLIVPKTTEKLRVISMEPLENMFLQQGQKDVLMRLLQSHPLTRGHVNFDDQTINRDLALVNSSTRDFATIDLSSASDRLSLELVEALFSKTESSRRALRYLKATRSTHTKLPDGRLVELRKWAPMGSATTFPVQSICFFALCVAAISIATNKTYQEVVESVYVYGDDIIVKSCHVQCVAEALTGVGLKVNLHKSFSKGYFRESCGMYAYQGTNVTPIRFKSLFPRTRADGRGISSWLSYAHALELNEYPKTAEVIYTAIEGLIGELPYGFESCGYFCRLAHSHWMLRASGHKMRWNKKLQRLEIRALGVAGRLKPVSFSDDWQRLLRDLLVSYRDSDPTMESVARSSRTRTAWHPVS
jgi:hypothetical protein